MPGSLVLRNASLLDVESGEYAETDIRCADGRIAETGAGLLAGDDDRSIDVRGSAVLPGLIDCHVHLTAVSADLSAIGGWSPNYVAAGAFRRMNETLDRGFTTVRDTGGADYGLAEAQADGLVRGPRVVFGGRSLSQTGGHGDRRSRGVTVLDDHPCCAGTSRVADGVDAVRTAARDELRKGAHHIKVHASGGVSSPTDRVSSTQYSMDELRAAVEEANAAERYVTTHAYPARAINRALEAGVRCVEHGNLLDDRSIDLLVEKEAFLVPTLVTYVALRREGMDHGLSRSSWQKVDDVLDSGLGALESAAKRGVRLAYGTDLLAAMGKFENEEFRIRAQVQEPIDVIRSATTTAAELLRMPGEIGCLTPGAHADLCVFDGDPLDDIDVLANPDEHLRLVVQAGSVVRESAAD